MSGREGAELSQKPVFFPALISLDVAVAAGVFSAGPGTVTGFVVCVTSRPIATFPLLLPLKLTVGPFVGCGFSC